MLLRRYSAAWAFRFSQRAVNDAWAVPWAGDPSPGSRSVMQHRQDPFQVTTSLTVIFDPSDSDRVLKLRCLGACSVSFAHFYHWGRWRQTLQWFECARCVHHERC